MRFATLRFLTALIAIGAGATLGVGAFVFSSGTERWVGFGVGAGVLATILLAAATAGRGTFQRCVDALLIPASAWALVAARAVELHSSSLTKWLGFSAGSAITGLGLIALIGHEIAVEADLRWALERLTEDAAGRQAREPDPGDGAAVTPARVGAPVLALAQNDAGRGPGHEHEIRAQEWHP